MVPGLSPAALGGDVQKFTWKAHDAAPLNKNNSLDTHTHKNQQYPFCIKLNSANLICRISI